MDRGHGWVLLRVKELNDLLKVKRIKTANTHERAYIGKTEDGIRVYSTESDYDEILKQLQGDDKTWYD